METDSPQMPHAADLDDSQLLAAGDIGALLARYETVFIGRCIARLNGSLDAEDVAQDVKLRLLGEYRRGKRYGDLPYRVVVHQVIGWTTADHFAGRRTDVPLPEDWQPSDLGEGDDLVGRGWVEWAVSQVPGKDGQVIALRYRDEREPAEIAERLGIKPNAVYQAIHRGLERLRMIEHA